MSVLFDGVDDYNQAIVEAADGEQHRAREPVGLRLGGLKVGLNSALIKDLLRDITLAEVARRHNMDLATTKFVLHQFPRLAHQRKRANSRRLRSLYRTAALQLKESNPWTHRRDLQNMSCAGYAWLAHHDRGWLDSNFPLKRRSRERASFCAVNLDIKTIASAETVDEQLAREGQDHARRHLSLPINSSGEEILPWLRTADRQLIAAPSLLEHEESKPKHRDRCLQNIRQQVEAGCLWEARKCAGELLLTYPRDRTVISLVLSCLLPDASQTAKNVGLEAAYSAS